MKLYELEVGDKVVLDSFESPDYIEIYKDNYHINIGDTFTIETVNGDNNMKCVIAKNGAMVIAGAAIFKKI